MAESQPDNNIEDEIMTVEDQKSFQEMMDEISAKEDEADAKPQGTCPFANGGADPLSTLGMGMGKNGMGMGDIGTLSGMAMPPMGHVMPPELDPMQFSLALLNLLNVLQSKIQEAMSGQELGVCPQIKPIDIFLSPTPYLAYQDVISTSEGEDAMTKIGYLQTDLENYLASK